MKIYENTSTLVRETTLATLKLEDNLTAFKRTTKIRRDTTTGSLKMRPENTKPIFEEGFVDDANLKKLISGKAYTAIKGLSILLEPGRELLRHEGYVLHHRPELAKRLKESIIKDTFDAFHEGKATVEDLVRYHNESHMLHDRHDVPLPVAVPFDYISHGRVTNKNYDLKKMAAHLLARRDIIIFPSKGGWKKDEPDEEKKATTVEEAICEIPYYNRDNGKTHTIYFRWIPSAEDYKKMWDACTAKNDKYPSTRMHEAIFELDLLGLKAAGTAYKDNYWADVEYEKEND